MSIRLYPDFIVASQINNTRRVLKLYSADWCPERILITYDELLYLQREYKHFAIATNVFIGFDGKEWDENDYKAYFKKLPQYFELQSNGCIVDLVALSRDIENIRMDYDSSATDDELFQVCLRKRLFTEGIYTQRVCENVGLGGPKIKTKGE